MQINSQRELDALKNNTVYIANLQHCKGGVESPISPDDSAAIEAQLDAIKHALVTVDNKNTAQCGDERCYLCSAADVNVNSQKFSYNEPGEFYTTYQLFGGLFVSATFAAQIAGLSLVNPHDNPSFSDAFDAISAVLSHTYEDSGHTTDLSFNDSKKTECGFEEGFTAALTMTLADPSLLAATKNVVAVLSGASSFQELDASDQGYVEDIIEAASYGLSLDGYMNNNPVAHRDLLKQKYGGKNLAVLQSANDETHGHYAKSLVVVEDLEHTVNQRELALDGNDSFVYHRGFAGQIAKTLGGSDIEARKLALAYDFSSVVIANKLFGKNMPVYAVNAVQEQNL